MIFGLRANVLNRLLPSVAWPAETVVAARSGVGAVNGDWRGDVPVSLAL